MRVRWRGVFPLLVLWAGAALAGEYRPLVAGAAGIKHRLDKLRVCGSVLMIAAHPDDENTALLAYFARGRKYRTAYLSLTRGEGGQNLVGPEQGDKLGIIRGQELLAARRIDGAEQYFTRAIDFGFSKTPEETIEKWGREGLLADTVWTIRRFQPDIIILRFSGTPRDGHGHHQASAILAMEAWEAAADPRRFPEQLHHVQPWRAKRVLFNLFAFTREMEQQAAAAPNRMEVEIGAYDPVLGYSYGEIAGISRSMHRSQGFGSAERKGSMKAYLTVVAGDAAATDPLDGVDTTWARIPGGAEVDEVLEKACDRFDVHQPEKSVPALIEARRKVAALDHPWARHKLSEIDELLPDAAGLWLDAAADRHTVVPGREMTVTLTALNRGKTDSAALTWQLRDDKGSASLEQNQPWAHKVSVRIPVDHPYTQPHWLLEPPDGSLYRTRDPRQTGEPESAPAFAAAYSLNFDGETIHLTRPVLYRWVDPVRGELTRPLAVAPPVSVSLGDRALLFPSGKSRRVEVRVQANIEKVSGDVSLRTSDGWSVRPASLPFDIATEGQQRVLAFEVAPPAADATGEITAVARIGDAQVAVGTVVIDYPHIPPQTLTIPARMRVHRADVRTLVTRVGYIMGAGDEAPQALRQLGIEVAPLGPEEVATGDLSRYEAIVTGVRAFNTRDDVRANAQRLFDYVEAGGTLVVQYNVLEFSFLGNRPRSMDGLGPYPLRLSRDRVTVEESPLVPLNADHVLLREPNRITGADYDGWVQERGLYYPGEWDSRYEPVWQSNDPGERPLKGATLYARHGKGVYIYTSLSWFRQLPAGVPGAYRIFANLISAGLTAR
jgi:LmbE family N-acetylglucosaminyl deacetylase